MSLTGPKAAVAGLALIAVLLPAAAGVSYWNTLRVVRNQQWVTHTHRVLEQVEEIRATLADAEADQRGFLLTGETPYLETFEASAGRIRGLFQELKELMADNPDQQAHLARLQAAAYARLQHLRRSLSVRREQGLDAARRIVATDEGHQLMDRVRAEIAVMQETENALLVRRLAQSERSLRQNTVTLAAWSSLGLLAVGLAYVLFRRALDERRWAEERQTALAELRHHALSDVGEEPLMQRAVALVARVLDVPLVKFLELLPDGRALLLRAGVGWTDGTVGRVTVHAGLDSQAGYTLYASKPVVAGDLTTHEPIVVDDLRTETRFSGPALLTDHGVVSGMSVIVYDRPDRPFGVLGAHTTRRRRFRDEDAKFLQTMANILAVALQRRRAEAALRDSESRFRGLANSIPEIVWTSGPDGRCHYLNRRWTEFTGRSREQPGREGWAPAIHGEDRAGVAERWAQALESGERFEAECRLRGADGSYRWCSGRAVPLRDASGQIVQWFGHWVDIDEHRRLESNLREADRKKDLFLATLGHELRNPLASITHAVELLKGHAASDGPVLRETGVIETQARQLKRLVEDLLDASRIAEGKIRVEREVVELGSVVAQAVEEVSPQVDARHQKLNVQIPRAPVRLYADPVRLVQILANLLSNAVRYTEPGGQIALEAEREGSGVLIRVRDTGAGIAAETLPQLFQMFVQARRPGSREGLGIGLALVKKLAELHGGSVEARSEGPGRGSEFRVRLPALSDDEAFAATAGETTAADVALGPQRVLIVEDNELLADEFARLLRREGCEVRVAGSGREALGGPPEFQPEIAFLDVGLPDMSGYELLARLRERKGFEHTLFVAVTGDVGKLGDPSAAAGFDHHLVKPVEIQVVKRLLREPRRHAARASQADLA